MLLSYVCSNYRSFAKEAQLDLQAPKSKVRKRFPDNFTTLSSGIDVLKEAFIVGENAGGKSNYIDSMRFLKSLFVSTGKPHALQTNIYDGFRDSLYINPQSFELDISIEERIYRYSVELTLDGVQEERLTDITGDQFSDVFYVYRLQGNQFRVRVYDQFHNSGLINRMSEEIITENFEMGLSVVRLAIAGHEIAAKVVDWVTNKLEVASGFDHEADGARYLNLLSSEDYLDIFRLVDTSITRIDVDERRPFLDTVITRASESGTTYTRLVSEDSSGVQEFMKWAALVYEVVFNDKVVFADEVDRVMNPILADRVIAYINGSDHHGQFIFTTHNILHLSLKNYMKEQIYFATKDKETLESSLYSLSEFNDIRYDVKTEVYEFYLRGVLGGTAYE